MLSNEIVTTVSDCLKPREMSLLLKLAEQSPVGCFKWYKPLSVNPCETAENPHINYVRRLLIIKATDNVGTQDDQAASPSL